MAAVETRAAAQRERELAALRDGAALSPLSERAILLARGSDRASFLQGMLSNDVASLSPGRGTYALLLTEQGRVVAELYVLSFAEVIWLELPAAARNDVRAALERFIVADDVELEDLAVHGFAVRGPDAARALGSVATAQAAALTELPESAHLELVYGGGTIHAARVRDHGGDGFHLWSDEPDRLDALAVALLASGVVPVSDDVLEIERITRGWARAGADYDAQTLAAEVPSFVRSVSYRKGCYLGQEVMERIAARGHVNWLLVRLTGGTGSSFSVGAKVTDEGAEVGKVTSVAELPEHRGGVVALARVRAAVATAGRRLTVVDGGSETAVEVATIPVAG